MNTYLKAFLPGLWCTPSLVLQLNTTAQACKIGFLLNSLTICLSEISLNNRNIFQTTIPVKWLHSRYKFLFKSRLLFCMWMLGITKHAHMHTDICTQKIKLFQITTSVLQPSRLLRNRDQTDKPGSWKGLSSCRKNWMSSRVVLLYHDLSFLKQETYFFLLKW